MKKRLAMLLIVTLLLSCLSPAAFAGQYRLFGDGSRSVITIKDLEGDAYTYYDIFDGATERSDLNNPESILRHMLLGRNSLYYRTYNLATTWDVLMFESWGNCIPQTWPTEYAPLTFPRFRESFTQYPGMPAFDEFKTLLISQNPVQAEEAIRETFMSFIHNKVDPRYDASRIKPIADLRTLVTDGLVCSTVNMRGVKNSPVLAFGSVFYDFTFHYINDGSSIDAGTGSCTSFEEAIGRRGVRGKDIRFVENREVEHVNATDKPITVNRIGIQENTVTIKNTVPNQLHSGNMISALAPNILAIPFTDRYLEPYKTTLTADWASTLRNGKSASINGNHTYGPMIYEDTIPPMTRSYKVDYQDQRDIEIDYDYRVALKYKVAQYVIWSDRESGIVAKFGMNNNKLQESASENLRKRMAHRLESGYEAAHANGYPLNWEKGRFGEPNRAVANNLPMTVTSATLGISTTMNGSVPFDMEPINEVSQLRLDGGEKSLKVNAGDTLDLTANLSVDAVDERGVPVYGFDELRHGQWQICDAGGKVIGNSPLAQLKKQADGCVTLRAGTAASDLYVKYSLDNFAHADPNGVDDAPSMVKVSVLSDGRPFDGTVTVNGPILAGLRAPLDLRRNGPLVSVLQNNGIPILGASYGLTWRAVGAGASDVSIKSNVLTANRAGEYTLVVNYGGVDSNEIKLVVPKGTAAEGVALDRTALTLNQFESAQLTARVLPVDTENPAVTWESRSPSVATVDDSGRVRGVATGNALIVATSENGRHQATCVVTVQVPDPGEGLNRYKIAMQVGAIKKMGAPGGASGIWRTADASIASISGSRLRAKKLGVTTLSFHVTAAKGTSFQGKQLASGDVIQIPVAVRRANELVTSVSLPIRSTYIAPGETLSLSPRVKPAKALDREVFYQTSDKTVALVDNSGLVRGIGAGKATITVTTATGKTAKISLRVTNDLRAIKLSATERKLTPGESCFLEATPVPAGLPLTPYYLSSDPNVATVTQSGMITAIAKGRCTITVHTAKGSGMKSKMSVIVR